MAASCQVVFEQDTQTRVQGVQSANKTRNPTDPQIWSTWVVDFINWFSHKGSAGSKEVCVCVIQSDRKVKKKYFISSVSPVSQYGPKGCQWGFFLFLFFLFFCFILLCMCLTSSWEDRDQILSNTSQPQRSIQMFACTPTHKLTLCDQDRYIRQISGFY